MTGTYEATIRWMRDGAVFTDNRYSRGHTWSFDGGLSVPASSSPHVVRVPLSREDAIDPEEAFVASLSSCHMLFFLSFAAQQKIIIDNYTDNAEGVMAKADKGKLFLAKAILRPEIAISGARRPTVEELSTLHHRAHEECFIANSIKTDVVIEALPPIFI